MMFFLRHLLDLNHFLEYLLPNQLNKHRHFLGLVLNDLHKAHKQSCSMVCFKNFLPFYRLFLFLHLFLAYFIIKLFNYNLAFKIFNKLNKLYLKCTKLIMII